MDAGALGEAGTVLADGGIETAIAYGTDYRLPELQTIGMLDDPAGRRVLTELWTGYLRVAERHRLPIVVGTPTWRGGPDRLRAAGRPDHDLERLNREGLLFQRQLVADLEMAASACVAGVLAPRRDGYDPTDAPGVDEAAGYHAGQAAALAGADLLFAVPLPAAAEALGICRAMAATGTPYVPSFLVDPAGRLPDGTPLAEVVDRIDRTVDPAPLHYSVSCVHPAVALAGHRAGLGGATGTATAGGKWGRVRELKANGSSLPPAVLDKLTHLVCDPPEEWADAMVTARDALGLLVVGGCCGTGASHLDALADRLAGSPAAGPAA
ncbi:MAG TPA: homocysteine S-methyltransferase family protein [Acidimicrobiales bacterium]|nr:homocysteine S-methyltransferase family protein [Acidimicrobiales bacterium]